MTSWWRRLIETFSTWLALCEGNPPLTGGFPSKRPVTRSSDIFFDLSLNKRSRKRSRRWWFEMPWRSLWRHCKASHGTGDRALSEPMMTQFTNPTYDHLATLIMHYIDVIMSAMASQITSLTIVYSTVYSGADQKQKSFASLAFVRGIHRWPVGSPHKGPVTRKMFPFDDVITDNIGLYGIYFMSLTPLSGGEGIRPVVFTGSRRRCWEFWIFWRRDSCCNC